MVKATPELTSREWYIIKTVWELQPCAAGAVQEHLAPSMNWHYSTVKTMMDRMVKKGILKTEKIRNLTLYRSVITQAKAQKGELRKTLKQAFAGSVAPMMKSLLDVSTVSQDQLDELEALLKEKRKEGAKRKKPT